MPDADPAFGQTPGVEFPPTHWSVVIHAGKDSSPDARAALGRLYTAYRPALLAFVRKMGCSDHEAQDLVNGFFEFLLEKHGLRTVQRTGKFRSWLVTCLRHYLYDRRDKQQAKKRGGDLPHVPLSAGESDCEAAPGIDPRDPGLTPDAAFNRQFALSFLQKVVSRLEAQYASRGRGELFKHLHPFLLEKKGAHSHAELGLQIGMSEGQINQEITRIRRRYRQVFDEELLNLVCSREEMDEEKRFLFAVLSQ